jgi:hypothetical protein
MWYNKGGFRGRIPSHSMGPIDVFVVTETRTDGLHRDGALVKVSIVDSPLKASCHVHGNHLILLCLGSRRPATQILGAPSMSVQTTLRQAYLAYPSHLRHRQINMRNYFLNTSLTAPVSLVYYFVQHSVWLTQIFTSFNIWSCLITQGFLFQFYSCVQGVCSLTRMSAIRTFVFQSGP